VKSADKYVSARKTLRLVVMQRPILSVELDEAYKRKLLVSHQKEAERNMRVNVNFLLGKKSARGRINTSPVASPACAKVGIVDTPA
jgi:hypothetical protein